MVSGATSLNLVRDELFTTMEEAESSLEQFIADRHNGSLLQQAVDATTLAVAGRISAARALTSARSSCGIRAAGVPLRGEKGKIWAWTIPSSAMIARFAPLTATK